MCVLRDVATKEHNGTSKIQKRKRINKRAKKMGKETLKGRAKRRRRSYVT